jgi:DnaJ-class molecular chaperone
MVEFRDYYATLGVPKTATEAEIKRAYRKLARKYHPDLNPGDKAAEAKFKEINEANEVLGNPETRRKYDELGANWKMYEHAPPPGAGRSGAAGGPGASWSAHFGGPGGATYRTMTPEQMEELFGTDDPFSDFFHTFFSGRTAGPSAGARSRPRGPRRGHDYEQPVELTLEEAFGGASRRLVIPRDAGERTIDVRIPAGVRDGMRVRASGEGGAGTEGGSAGDLFLVVRLQPHARFDRRGDDLHVRVGVPVTTAVLGGEVAVPTLAGSTLRLKVPEVTRAGRVFRLRGHGMPVLGRTGERGDLYATVEIEMPAHLSAEERRHWEALKSLAG